MWFLFCGRPSIKGHLINPKIKDARSTRMDSRNEAVKSMWTRSGMGIEESDDDSDVDSDGDSDGGSPDCAAVE